MQTIQETVHRIFDRELAVAFVAWWESYGQEEFVQGYISDPAASSDVSQVVRHLDEFEIPMPIGDWTIFYRDGSIRIVEN